MERRSPSTRFALFIMIGCILGISLSTLVSVPVSF